MKLAALSRREALAASLAALTSACATPAPASRIPVIFNTDIGGDIDDAWALMQILRTPELDLKLVSTDGGVTSTRASIAAKILEACGRANIPISLGNDPTYGTLQQSAWLGDYKLAHYPAAIHFSGAAAIAHEIISSAHEVTVISVSPATTLAAALALEPRIAERARFVGMYGSIRRGMPSDAGPIAEWNVKQNAAALRAIFAAPWQCTITPLDTCAQVVLDGADYQRIRQSRDPFARLIVEQYESWRPHADWLGPDVDPAVRTSTLFDCTAVELAHNESAFGIETLPLVVTDDGYTRIDPAGRPVRCATSWRDLAGLKAKLSATFAS
ncbi:MAG: nucleoside hydrolase [Pseudomonadota bacterium]